MQWAEWMNNIKPFINLKENQILSLAMWGEARGEDWEGIAAVMNVIRNRVNDAQDRYSESRLKSYGAYHAVILKPYQFSCFLKDDPNKHKLELIAADFSGYLQDHGFFDKLFLISIIKDLIIDNTNGANHYYAKTMKTAPSWASAMTVTAEIGDHIFMKD